MIWSSHPLGFWFRFRFSQTCNCKCSTSKANGVFNRFSCSMSAIFREDESVDSNVDVMTKVFVECWWIFKISIVTIHTPIHVSLFNELLEQISMCSFTCTNNRTPNGNGVLFENPQNVVNDLLDCSTCNLFSAFRTVRFADSRPQ